MARKDQPGRPTVEDRIAAYRADPEFSATDEADPERKRLATIVQKFRIGAKHICAEQMWAKMEAASGTGNAIALAALLKIRREETYKLRKGGMTLEMLIALVSELGWDLAKLDPLPSLHERGLAGFQVAVHWARTGDAYPQPEERITEAEFLTVCVLLRHLPGGGRPTPADYTLRDWNALAARLRPHVAAALSKTEADVKDVTGARLKGLHERWAKAVAECVDAVPHRWTAGDSAR